MLALIYREGASAMLDVGGRPLLGRQIQWLRAIGCSRIAVELGDDALASRIAAWLAEGEIAAPDLVPVLAACGSTPRALASRAGFSPDAPFLAVPGDVLGDGDLVSLYGRADARGVVAHLTAPEGRDAALGGATVRIVGPEQGPARTAIAPGHGVRVKDAQVALAVGMAIVQRVLGAEVFPIHAQERSPGVFVARGAIVDARAQLTAPVFVGAGAWIERDAVVGPFAVVGASAVVERGAKVIRAMVEDGMVVGEGLALERCHATLHGIEDFARLGAPVSLGDPLLLDTSSRLSTRWSARALAALCLPTLAPLHALGLSALPSAASLVDVLRGHRPLVGVGGAFDIEAALVEDDDGEDLRARARAWYAHQKGVALDFKLVFTLLRSPRRRRASLPALT